MRLSLMSYQETESASGKVVAKSERTLPKSRERGGMSGSRHRTGNDRPRHWCAIERVHIRGAMALASLLFVVGCGSEPRLIAPIEPTPPLATISPAAASPVATPATTVATGPLGAIVWAATVDPTTNAPLEAATTFAPDAARITAAVPVHALPAGATVTASWEYNNTSLDDFTTRMVLPESLNERWLAFFIERGSEVEWPEGEYAVTISVNEIVTQQAAVDVLAPD
jgi:hypothetical protein